MTKKGKKANRKRKGRKKGGIIAIDIPRMNDEQAARGMPTPSVPSRRSRLPLTHSRVPPFVRHTKRARLLHSNMYKHPVPTLASFTDYRNVARMQQWAGDLSPEYVRRMKENASPDARRFTTMLEALCPELCRKERIKIAKEQRKKAKVMNMHTMNNYLSSPVYEALSNKEKVEMLLRIGENTPDPYTGMFYCNVCEEESHTPFTESRCDDCTRITTYL